MAGFLASAVTLLAFIAAYAVAAVVARAMGAEQAGAGVLASWLYALTHNTVIELGTASLYMTVAVYFAGGLLWALLYAGLAEPRLPGPAWARGMLFALLPAAVSLFGVLPLLGGGLLGLELGAGPLPLVGNVLLHLLYGATLGLLFGPFGDLSAEDFQPASAADRRTMGAAERVAARGILAGGLLGAIVGVVPALARQMDTTVLGVPPTGFLLATVLAGLTLGAFIGSFVGLAGSDGEVG
jgi:hypothetical protein